MGLKGLLTAILIGCLAVFAVRLSLFHLTGSALIGFDPVITMALEMGTAIAFSFLVFVFLPFNGFAARMGQIMGVVLMMTLMHNAVHAAPGLFGTLFSKDWTEDVIAATKPRSVYIPAPPEPELFLPEAELASQPDQTADLPRVIRLR